MLEASCHCGAVRLTVDEKPASLTACNCSICHRIGAQWAYYKQRQVRIDCAPDALETYRWKSKRLEFCRCRTCGCTTHYITVEKKGDGHFALNGRAVEPAVLADVPIRPFDGRETFRYLDG